MEYKDYYKVLGVPKTAPAADINKAYRKLARKYHPDLNPGDKGAEARFKEINEAHEVLTDPDKRQKYDTLGSNWNRPGFDMGAAMRQAAARGRTRTTTTAGNTTTDSGGDSFSDFFQTIFGQATRGGAARTQPPPARARRGEDIEQPVEVTLDEAFSGGQRMFTLTGQDRCATCSGTGLDQDGKTCPTCKGTGWTNFSRRIEVKIPAGVRDGSRIRIAGEGNPGAGAGPRGDLYLVVTLKAHPRFRVEEDNLLSDLDVPYTTLVLGGEAVVPTVKGKVLLKVPAGTANGKQFRLAGQGLPRLKDGTRGDLLVKVHALLPGTQGSPLSNRERELFDELSSLNTMRATAQ
ncbi:MAG TPA: J domain-containing protein [Chloroflexota bacterium]|nr:J domain-containing protein [Chloroflexota bacterium]